MQTHNLVAVGDVGFNLHMLVSWEWNPANQLLVIHLRHNILYLRDQTAQAMWLLLDSLATLHMGEQQAMNQRQRTDQSH